MKLHCRTDGDFSIFVRMFLLSLMLLFGSKSIQAQHYHFKQISTADGVPSALVYRIHQDKKGYFWYLTNKGIGRFDGKDWKYFSSNDGYEDVGAFHIAESESGTLWFITTNFKLYCYTGTQFYHVFPDKEIAWIEFFNNQMHLITRAGELFSAFSSGEERKVMGSKTIWTAYSMLPLSDNRFIISNNLGTYLKRKNEPEAIPLLKSTIFRNHIIPRIFRLKNGHVLLTNQRGIYDFDPSTETFKMVIPLVNNEVISFYEDRETHDIWLGTYHGIYHYPLGVISAGNEHVYLQNQTIFSITKAQSGNYFFATMSGGVFRCNFKVLHLNREEGLGSDNIAFVRQFKEAIYLFTLKGKVHIIKDGKVMPLKIDLRDKWNLGLIQNVNNLRDSVLLINNHIWDNKTLKLLNMPFGAYSAMFFEQKEPNLDQWVINELRKDSPFVGKMDIAENILSYLVERGLRPPSWRGLRNENGRFFLMLPGKQQTRLGEVRYSYDSIIKHRFYPVTNFISDLRVTPFGSIIVSTLNRGIAIIKGDKAEWIGAKQGLPSDYCSKILMRDGKVWVSTNKGISRIDIDRYDNILRINNFTADNFLLDNEVNDFTLTNNDSVYVATANGVSAFHTNTVLGSSTTSVYIENIQINDVDTQNTGSFDLPYNRNNINVFYKSPDDGIGGKVLYKYIIEGLTPDTVYTNVTMLRLGSILPGQYLVKIWSLNMNGSWNTTPAMVSFLINKPFWKTVWFILMVALLLIICIVYATYLYLKSKQEKTETQTKLIESELRSLRLHMNPHFVFNSLTSLQAYILTNKTDEAEDFISNFSSLVRSIMSYSIKGEIVLKNEVDLLKQYVALELVRFKDQFEYEISVDVNVDQDIIIPSLLIQPFVENAIKHGLSGLNRKGKLTVFFTKAGDELHCIVQDNGRGYVNKRSEQFKQSGNDHHISTGISFTSERIKLLIKDSRREPISVTELFKDNEPYGIKVDILVPVLNETE